MPGQTNTCSGTKTDGSPCGARPKSGTQRCWRHPNTSDTPTHARPERWDRQAFLDAFGRLGMVSAACDEIGVGRSTVYEERQRNEDFAVAWADVEERTTERMEAEAYRRAVDGTEVPVVARGEIITHVRRYSDTLLQFMLKARRPQTYRERVDLSHSGEVTKRVRVDLERLDADELAELEKIAAKLEV